MKIKLKPCPFCGGEAYSRFVPSLGCASIKCRKCGAVPYVYIGIDKEDAVKGVSEAWNRRIK